MSVQNVVLLGATGSIGASTLDVLARHRDRFRLHAVTAWRQMDRLASIILEHRPALAIVADAAAADALRALLAAEGGADCEIQWGEAALCAVSAAPETDTVMAAIVGAAGLAPTLAAARAGKRVLLANKEALVMSGDLLLAAVRQSGATLLPIDSEHNAVFQSLPRGFDYGLQACGVHKVLLTASGGPFRTLPLAQLASVTPEQAVAHPNWVMGRKISVDSATMMNKGLEVIEAHWLFGVEPARIEVVVHPQSVIHSMVHYVDGSVVAQLGNPDMRTPIAHALAYPERIDAGVPALDFATLAGLCFEAPDLERFPCLALAIEALRVRGTAPAVLNAANEEAVAAFLDRRIGFTRIAEVVRAALHETESVVADSIDVVLEADRAGRARAQAAIRRMSGG